MVLAVQACSVSERRLYKKFGIYIERVLMMQEVAVSPLPAWENFYVIVGSAAAALTGLMFVVVTLIAGNPSRRSGESVAAFGTPTVVHFGAALLIAAIISAPWSALWNAGLLLGLTGLGGVGYVVIVTRRAQRQTDYQPVLEDWIWHVVFPFASYLALVITGFLVVDNATPALFVTGAATVLLLFIGIHNSWDTVTYLTIQRARSEDKSQD